MITSFDISIVVPTLNRPHTAYDLVVYLRTVLFWNCKIILIDQSDDHGDLLKEKLRNAGFTNVIHEYQDQRGTSLARNKGALLAESQWLLFLDDDVRPTSKFLELLTAFINSNPWVDTVTLGLAYQAEWDAYNQNRGIWKSSKLADPIRKPQPLVWDAAQWFTGTPIANYQALSIGISSGNFAISRTAFRGVGGFDENMEGLGEDRELGMRLWWYGYRVCYTPHIVSFHLAEKEGGTRMAESVPFMKRILKPDISIGWIYFYLKWFPKELGKLMVTYYLVKWLQRPWTIPVKLLRFYIAYKEANSRLINGPRYIAEPVSRENCINK